MGNCCVGSSPVVHPSEPHQQQNHMPEERRSSLGALQIKVRMTAREFKRLLDEAELSKEGRDIGQLIVRECLRGKCHARFAGQVENEAHHGKVRSLDTITEEEN